MKTVQQVSRLTGISVRTLHYYDQIGLLPPTAVTPAGYRLYDDAALETLQTILLFRELEFPLAEIRQIVYGAGFDRRAALERQIGLLEGKRDRLTAIIAHARQIQNGGEIMDFKAFDDRTLERYREEARQAWGQTEAYREYEQKTAGQSAQDEQTTAAGLMAIFAELGALRDRDPAEEAVQKTVGRLQAYITEHYYTCTDTIFASLGQMYAAGGEMTANIDAAGGDGTAAFACRAIGIFVGR